ncbi:hypothetical protein [Lunatibacter salilacus]|uniref:hypothetical protein n=1 Tax=Lunatibacter salilacus TaxID=2483804 RepID=UPI00131DE151|nr:hypothetical protein [Lunatibacter salilacus]
MKKITINIPDNKYSFFLELVKNLGLEKVKEEPVNANQDALKGLEQGFKEVKMIQDGKMKGTPLNEFLDEL